MSIMSKNQIKKQFLVPMLYDNNLKPAESIEDIVYEVYYNEVTETLDILFINNMNNKIVYNTILNDRMRSFLPNGNKLMYVEDNMSYEEDILMNIKLSINTIMMFCRDLNIDKYICTYEIYEVK